MKKEYKNVFEMVVHEMIFYIPELIVYGVRKIVKHLL